MTIEVRDHDNLWDEDSDLPARYGSVMIFTPLQRALSLTAVIAASFGVGLSFGVVFPLTSLTFEAWGQSEWMIGLAGGLPAVVALVAFPLLPSVVARIGPVTAIAGGCLVGGAGFLALYAFQSPWAWIAIRVLMSAGFALPWLAGETWINTVSREETRGRVIAIYTIAFFAGFSIGPFILQTFGLVGWPPFLAGAAGTALAGVPIILAQRIAPKFYHDGSMALMSALRADPVAMVAAFVGGFAEIGCLALYANVAVAAGLSQVNALQLLSVMTAGGVILQFPIGWLSDKSSRYLMMLVLVIAFIILLLGLPMAFASPIASFVAAFLFGGIILGFYTVGLAMIGERVAANDLAAANAAFLFMYQGGSILGPIVGGAAMTISPVTGFVVAMVALTVVSGVAIVALEFRERQVAKV